MHSMYTAVHQEIAGSEGAAAVFHAHNVTKLYIMGEVQVQALRSVTLDLYDWGSLFFFLGLPEVENRHS